MQCDCPVVCSNTSSIPEVVGDAAQSFDPTQPGALQAALEALVSSEARRDELIAQGRERRRQFSWDACASQTLALYRRLRGHA
jgi:glycosyltransferase involved in cell wall biosynthesis